MIKITLNDLSSFLEIPVRDINYDQPISDFSIDSRTVKKGDAYIAIEGEKYNGNDFVLDAIKNGATIAFTSNKEYLAPNIFYVKDGKEFLKKIAGFIMKIINPKVIAVTGSNGKTTTKEITASILQQEYSQKELLIAQGNFNNDIGLPLTILRLNEVHKIAILEMGMNHKGEIEDLTRITPPDIAVITNIGEAHIENFESRDGIAAAKKEILANISKNSFVILPRDDKYFEFLATDLVTKNIITFGKSNEADISCASQDNLITRYFLLDKFMDAKSSIIGDHNIMNIMAAIGVAQALKISINSIKKGIESFKGVAGRLEVKHAKNGAIIIDDSYNSNPSSMIAAIDVLASHTSSHKLLVIGDMAELGEQSQRLHSDIIKYINDSGISHTLAIGDCMKQPITNNIKYGSWYNSKNDLIKELRALMKEDSVVLFKGSRLMKMEEIIHIII
jgi:UDP-N-acetylmuramoyl-tripeptide--D-alanyl-D-alanine ligase